MNPTGSRQGGRRTTGTSRSRRPPVDAPPAVASTVAPVRPRPRATWWLEGPGWPFVRPLSDLVALVVALLLTVNWPGEPVAAEQAKVLLVLPPLAMLALAARGMYARRLRLSVLDGIGPVLGALSIASMMVVVASIYLVDAPPEIGVMVHAWALSVVCVGVGRIAIAGVQRRGRTRWGLGRRTLVVGAGFVGQRVAHRLEQLPEYGLRPVGFLDASPRGWDRAALAHIPVLGGTDALEDVARETGAEHVLVAFSSEPDRRYLDLVQRCERAGLTVSLVPRLFDAMNDRAVYESLGGLPLLALHRTDPRSWQFAVKHGMDRVIAGLLILVCSPLLLSIALAVRLSSPGPVLFRQRRVGRDGRAFDLLKFRSMAPPREGTRFQPRRGEAPGGIEGEDRRTAIGRLIRRTSLDELPQLLNVAKGEMSLVGPRPERPDFVELFVRDIDRYDERHRVRAGMTGWAQVHGLRGQTSLADRVEWDNWYIEHWSLALDLKILLRTITAVFRSAE